MNAVDGKFPAQVRSSSLRRGMQETRVETPAAKFCIQFFISTRVQRKKLRFKN